MKIGELASKAGVSISSVRFYEKQGLMPTPDRRDSGYREYSQREVERLKLIAAAKRHRFPLNLIRVVVTAFDEVDNPCEEVAGLVRVRLKSIAREIADLQDIERTLRGQLERWEKGEAPTADCMCAIIQTVGETSG